MKKNDMVMAERYGRLAEDDDRREMMENEGSSRLKTRLGWRRETMNAMQEFDVNRQIKKDNIPPWYATKVIFDGVELTRKKEEYSSEELKELTLKKIEEINADVEIYTDGSTGEEQRNGGAGTHAVDRLGNVLYEKCEPAGSLCSSYNGETVAMLEATRWISVRDEQELHYVVLTDSKSLVDALKADNWRDNHEWLSKIKTNIDKIQAKLTILWIPSHCETDGNERADTLAKEGSKMDQSSTPVTYNIIKAKIKNKKWDIKHRRAREIYGERRGPRRKIERKWPRKARSMYARLRTDHCKELQNYQCNKLGKAETAACPKCGGEDDTIRHILCKCPSMEEKRQQIRIGEWTVDALVDKPQDCMKLLRHRLPELDKSMPEDQPKKAKKNTSVFG